MADYYSILKKTIGSLPENNGAARRSVYSRARNAIVNQLKAYEPPLSPSEITSEQLRLEEAIRKVEAEAARESLGLAPQSKPAAPPPSVTPPAAPQSSVQDDADRPSQTAETTQSHGRVEPVVAAPAAPATSSPLKQAVEESNTLGEASHRAVENTKEALSTETASSSVRQEPSFSTGDASPYDTDEDPDDDDTSDSDPVFSAKADDRSSKRKRSNRREASAAFRSSEGSKFPVVPVAIVGLLVLIAVGVAAFVFSDDEMVSEAPAISEPGVATPLEEAAPEETASESPRVVEAEPVAEQPDDDAGKIEDRLLDENGDPAAATDARSVTTTLITPGGEANGAQGVSDATSAETVAPIDLAPEPEASQPPAEESALAAVTPDPTAQAPAASADGASQRSILYEEGENTNGAGTASQGQVVWSVEEETDLDGNAQSVLSAEVRVPERNVSVDIRIKPNTDASLPASHLVEIKYDFPADFPAGDVVNVPGLVMKPTEEARGDALIGASVKVSPGYFWIALSNINSETERNIGLLRERGWIDIPMLYDNGKRGILTLEKGATGSSAVEQALAAWQAG